MPGKSSADMSPTTQTILVLGGAGAQNSSVIRQLVKNENFSIKLLSRDITSAACRELEALPNVTLVQGDCYDEDTLVSVFQGADGCFVNTNGFAIGEKSEIFWGIRMYEIAYWAGVKHFVYSSLPYVSKKSGFNPKYRVPFADGKAKVLADLNSAAQDYLKSQPTDKMAWTAIESGPYVESHLGNNWVPSPDENGVFVFRMPVGEHGASAYVSLSGMGWFTRYIFEHPKEFEADLLSVGIEHASGETVAKAFTVVTGKPARFEPLELSTVAAAWSDKKIGLAGSPGFDDPTLKTRAENFVPWFTIWSESGGNKGLWTKDYERLDGIFSGSTTVEFTAILTPPKDVAPPAASQQF